MKTPITMHVDIHNVNIKSSECTADDKLEMLFAFFVWQFSGPFIDQHSLANPTCSDNFFMNLNHTMNSKATMKFIRFPNKCHRNKQKNWMNDIEKALCLP